MEKTAQPQEIAAGARGDGARLPALAARLAAAFEAALAREIALRRPFLWTPVFAGAGALLYFAAEREPSLALSGALLFAAAAAAYLLRAVPRLGFALALCACLLGGFFSAAWRTARVAAPVLPRAGIGYLTGFVEEVDLRRAGARFIVRVSSAEGLPNDVVPRRVRLTTRGEPRFSAGDFIGLKARLLPPARAALPGGYDFARDAFFLGIGAVGNALGRIDAAEPPEPAPIDLRFFAAIDRFRNALAQRVAKSLDGDTGAIAAAMVTGKRDLLSEEAKELIRRAGIFHIITISGVQMTLVAGVFFIGLRRLLALSPTLALHYPIKKWAAALAIFGAVFYDLATGSRVGTERALVMTVILLVAILFDRPALSMRNLAFAAFFVLLFQPEALLGASFQLSFAAVAALIAVYEARGDVDFGSGGARLAPLDWRGKLRFAALRGPAAPLFATLCATSATASFMANDFHEISPYVLIGNPLTLAIIEFFAVPCALIGAALYPLGLDGFVWRWLGLGIDLVRALAKLIAAAPGASLYVHSFAPWAILSLSLALLSALLWRSAPLRLTALPLAALGLFGATRGESFDLAVAANGEAAALRAASGELVILGRKPSGFVAEQWLRADADARAPADARSGASCDAFGCVGRAAEGFYVALVDQRGGFLEDCARARVIVTPLHAPQGCVAPIVIDRRSLAETGAVALRFLDGRALTTTARTKDEDRPWSPAPPKRRERISAPPPEEPEDANARDGD